MSGWAPTILDNLIAERRLPPMVAVFVSEIDRQTRARELLGNAAFADFMALELLPRVKPARPSRPSAPR